MNIAIASDHGGYSLKCTVKEYLQQQGHQVSDFGCDSLDSCDYPDFGVPAARAVAAGICDTGIVICTTGIGISIAANKVDGIRCALCGEPLSAKLTRQHNDTNMMALGAAITGPMLALEIIDSFLTTEFQGGRHQRRVDKIMAVERD